MKAKYPLAALTYGMRDYPAMSRGYTHTGSLQMNMARCMILYKCLHLGCLHMRRESLHRRLRLEEHWYRGLL